MLFALVRRTFILAACLACAAVLHADPPTASPLAALFELKTLPEGGALNWMRSAVGRVRIQRALTKNPDACVAELRALARQVLAGVTPDAFAFRMQWLPQVQAAAVSSRLASEGSRGLLSLRCGDGDEAKPWFRLFPATGPTFEYLRQRPGVRETSTTIEWNKQIDPFHASRTTNGRTTIVTLRLFRWDAPGGTHPAVLLLSLWGTAFTGFKAPGSFSGRSSADTMHVFRDLPPGSWLDQLVGERERAVVVEDVQTASQKLAEVLDFVEPHEDLGLQSYTTGYGRVETFTYALLRFRAGTQHLVVDTADEKRLLFGSAPAGEGLIALATSVLCELLEPLPGES